MTGRLFVLALGLLMSACAAVEPMSSAEMAASIGDPMRPGPGIFSGSSGEFAIHLR